MKTSEEGKKFILREEGCVLKAYRCPAGIWTIGVGHTGPEVKEGMQITLDQAVETLENDLMRFEDAVDNHVEKVILPQHEFDALVSFAFNVGAAAFAASTLLKYVNLRYSAEEIEKQFKRWNKAGGKELPILTARRAREANLFNKGVYE